MRYWPILLMLLAGCASTGSAVLTMPDGKQVKIEAVSIPVGWMHQALVVSTESALGVQTAVLNDTSAGQAIVNTGTTLGSVAGATVGVYEGLKASGSGISIP